MDDSEGFGDDFDEFEEGAEADDEFGEFGEDLEAAPPDGENESQLIYDEPAMSYVSRNIHQSRVFHVLNCSLATAHSRCRRH